MKKELDTHKEFRKIILDTNFWLLPFEYRVDVIAGLEDLFEYTPYIILLPTPVYDELKMMANSKNNAKKAIASKSAIELIDKLILKNKVLIVESGKKADDIILDIAQSSNAWVATNDKILRFRLKEKQIKTVILRDNHAICFA
jgi:hypothetical protein